MDRYDVLLVLGIVLLAIGFGLVYFPLGLIAGGAGCIAIAVIGARGQPVRVTHNATEKAKT